MADQKVIAALELILELIGRIDGRLDDIDRNSFIADRDEADLTAFRLSHIGESTRKLPAEMKARHPGIPWIRMVDMRNVISHEYGAIDPARIWKTATEDLDALAAVCTAELARLNG
jgi:uncharacterized protein with HEPN domain